LAQVYFEDVKEGEEIPPLVKEVTTHRLIQWAAASGDHYQIHYDPFHARSTGLKDVILHGALKNAFLGQFVYEWAGEQGRIVRFGSSYRGMDYPDQDIVCRGIITKKYEEDGEKRVDLEIWCESGKAKGINPDRATNPEGVKSTPGTATVALPSRG
jgi:hypothetical protein